MSRGKVKKFTSLIPRSSVEAIRQMRVGVDKETKAATTRPGALNLLRVNDLAHRFNPAVVQPKEP